MSVTKTTGERERNLATVTRVASALESGDLGGLDRFIAEDFRLVSHPAFVALGEPLEWDSIDERLRSLRRHQPTRPVHITGVRGLTDSRFLVTGLLGEDELGMIVDCRHGLLRRVRVCAGAAEAELISAAALPRI